MSCWDGGKKQRGRERRKQRQKEEKNHGCIMSWTYERRKLSLVYQRAKEIISAQLKCQFLYLGNICTEWYFWLLRNTAIDQQKWDPTMDDIWLHITFLKCRKMVYSIETELCMSFKWKNHALLLKLLSDLRRNKEFLSISNCLYLIKMSFSQYRTSKCSSNKFYT